MVSTFAVLLILVATPALAAVNHPAKITKAEASKALAQHNLEHEQLVTIPMVLKKRDCWKKRPIAMTQLAARVYKLNQTNPGAGIDVEGQKGYGTVTKDGFMEVACVKDYMYSHGDKDGPNKHEYEIGSSSNVSIVHYSMLVPKEDQSSMSAEVCFEFCRTVPDMLFFGLTAGRECYCLPFYKPMAGDSSKCDAVCEGEPTTFCGGMKKSSVFEMHFCDSTAGDLASAADKLSTFMEESEPLGKQIQADADSLQSAAEAGQAKFGAAGDTVMSDLMQSAKVFAGEIDKAVGPAVKKGEELSAAVDEAKGMDGADFTDPENMKKAEDLIKKMEEGLTGMEGMKEEIMGLHELMRGSEYSKAGDLKEVDGEPLKQFHPTMYFVDREFETVPSTCGGEVLKKPMLAFDAQECAAACSAEGIACAGFSYITLSPPPEVDKVCFLFSKMTSVTYYTECKKESSFLQEPLAFLQQSSFLQAPLAFLQQSSFLKAPLAFLQHTNATSTHAVIQKSNSMGQAEEAPWLEEPIKTMCFAKFSSFVGTTLKPDPSGKCDLCLKTADKAQRCFE